MKRLLRYGGRRIYYPIEKKCISDLSVNPTYRLIRFNSTTSKTVTDLVETIFKTDYNKTNPLRFNKAYPISATAYDIVNHSDFVSEYSGNGSNQLGTSFLVYFQSYQLILDPNGFDKDIVNSVNELISSISKDSEIEPSEVNPYISHLIKANSKTDINNVFNKYHDKNHQQRQTSSNLNLIVNSLGSSLPVVKGREINYSYLYTERESLATSRNCELPKFINELKFNPLLLFNSEVLRKYDKKLSKDHTIVKKWNLVYNFGLSAIEFHTHLIPDAINFKHDSGDEVIKTILQNSFIHRIIIFPKTRLLIEDLINTSKEFRTQMFYQYMGLKTLIDGFPIEWFVNLSATSPTTDSSESIIEDLTKLSPDYVQSKVTILKNNLRCKEDVSLSDAINEIDDKINHVIYKWIKEYDIPLPIIKPVQLRNQHDKSLPFKSPSISDNNRNRFKLINNGIIRPDANVSNWNFNQNIKQIIFLQDKYGDESYKLLINHYLQEEGGEIGKDIVEILSKILKSIAFKLFLIEFNEFFNNQSVRGGSNKFLFEKYLQFRFLNNFHSAQFNQYFANLTTTQQQNWAQSVVAFFIKILRSLNYDESIQFLQDSKNLLNKKQSVLVEISKRRVIERATNDNLLNDFVNKSALSKLDGQNDYGFKSGKHYFNYSIMRFNLKLALNSFLSSTREIQEIFSSLYPDNSYYKHIGSQIQNQSRYESNIYTAVRTLYDLNPTKLFDPTTKIEIINYEINNLPTFSTSMKQEMKDQWLGGFILPFLSDFYDVNRLSVVNYSISRTFFNQIGIHNKINMNRYSDLITMISSIGAEYYQYLICKSFSKFESKINDPTIVFPRLLDILNDKKFKLIINNRSTNELTLFKDNKHNSIYKQLYQQYASNEYYQLRFHNGQFNQYLGSIVITEPFMIDKWFEDAFEPLLTRLSKSTVEEQNQIIDLIEREIKSYNIKI